MEISMERPDADAKRSLRLKLTELRNGLPAGLRAEWSRRICGLASSWLESSGIDSVMVYAVYRSEVETRPLIEWAWRQGLVTIVPRCRPDNRSMTLFRLKNWSELIPGAYGIPEPDPHKSVECGEQYIPGAVIVPGLSFDRTGGRLGYGGGYYDRFHRQLQQRLGEGKPMPKWIGLAFEAQLTEQVPREPHDAGVDLIITERAMYEPENEEE